MNKTNIGWVDHSSNPIRARNIETGAQGHYCEKVSKGCENCYASLWNEKRYGTGLAFDVRNRDKVEPWLNEKELREWLKPKYRGKSVFVEDMSDLFGAWVPDEWLDRIFATMALAPEVTFRLLTKRIERAREYLTAEGRQQAVETAAAEFADLLSPHGPEAPALLYGLAHFKTWPLPNVQLGVSAEDQEQADKRIPVLLETPAAVRWVSYEPALGPVEFCHCGSGAVQGYEGPLRDCWLHGEPGLSWIVVGGESGRDRRPFEVAWARSVVAQCKAADVPCFVKQDSAFKSEQQGRIPDDLWAVKELPR